MIRLIKQFEKLQKATDNFFGIFMLGTFIFLASTVFLGYKVYQYNKPARSAEERVRALVAEVSAAMILPQDELPKVAKVADASQLNDQPFFIHAQTGDDILIYENNKKAILWRPSIKRIVEVSSLAMPAQTASTSSKR